jgi:hypothetical protein
VAAAIARLSLETLKLIGLPLGFKILVPSGAMARTRGFPSGFSANNAPASAFLNTREPFLGLPVFAERALLFP